MAASVDIYLIHVDIYCAFSDTFEGELTKKHSDKDLDHLWLDYIRMLGHPQMSAHHSKDLGHFWLSNHYF